MKKSVLLIVLLCAINSLNAQQFLKGIFDKYQDTEEVSSINLSGSFLNNILEVKDKDANIESLNVLIFNEEERLNPDVILDIKKELKSTAHEELFTVRDSGNYIEVYVTDTDDMIKTAVILITSDDHQVVASMEGNIPYSLMEEINISGKGNINFSRH